MEIGALGWVWRGQQFLLLCSVLARLVTDTKNLLCRVTSTSYKKLGMDRISGLYIQPDIIKSLCIRKENFKIIQINI